MRLWLALLVLWVASPAFAARTVAVLPLEAGVGSEAHAGLGRALAGMLVADLSKVAELQLVERTQLEQVLAEIKLGGEGYLDPTTAQRAGKGVGAEIVVLGAWSVVEGTFLMDARFVEVASGKVVKAAAANGPASDFVGVEKEVVEALLTGLAVAVTPAEKRKILGDAPTESFKAFTDYGAGLDAQIRGDIEAASRAFTEAVRVDPDFDEAQAALEGLRSLTEAARASDAAKSMSEWERQLLAVIEGTVDERTRARGFVDDLPATAAFGLRMQALLKAERHCQRAEELHHFLQRHGWRWTPPKGTGKGRAPMLEASHALGQSLGVVPAGEDPYRPDSKGGYLSWDGGSILRNEHALAFGNGDPRPWDDGLPGLLQSVVKCYPAKEAAKRVEAMRAEVQAAGVGRLIGDLDTYPGITFADRWMVAAALVDVDAHGMSARWQRELEALIARFPDDNGQGYDRRWALARSEMVISRAKLHARYEAVLLGLPPATYITAVNALSGHGGDPFDRSHPYCAYAVGYLEQTYRRVGQPALPADAPREALSRRAGELSGLVDFGCIRGVPARVSTAEQAFGLLRSAPSRRQTAFSDREEAGCEAELKRVESYTEPARIGPNVSEDIRHLQVFTALSWYYPMLVFSGCITR